MSDNKTVVDPADQTKPDWIELYNASAAAVDLAGFSLSDDEADVRKFTFAVGTTIAAGGFLHLWADGAAEATQGADHVGFKLSASVGDRLILTDADGYVVDQVEIPVSAENVAYARFPDGTGAWAFCATPTNGALNGSACPQ